MPNVEIEKKYAVDNLGEVEDTLIKLGATKKAEFHGIDTYFIVTNNPEGRKYLRIRDKNGKAELTYSFVESNINTLEWETEVSDIKITEQILEQLGFEHDVTIDKHRLAYNYLNSEVVLDTVKGLGTFVEVESPSEEEVDEISAKLGLLQSNWVSGMGYPDLLRGKLISN